jgi:hypothetical protein
VGAVRGGTRRLAEEEELTLGVPVATVAHGNGGTGPPAMAAGWQWLVTSKRRLGSGCWAPGSWSMKRWWAGQGGGTGGRASKEAAGRVRRRHWQPGEEGVIDGGVCVRDLAVRENGGGRDQKTEKGSWQFPNPHVALNPTPHIFIGGATSPINICGLYSSVTWLHR